MSENILNEKTLVPISLLVAIGGGILSVGLFISAVWYKETANAAAIVTIKENQSVLKDDLKEHILRIEDKVDRILERVK